MPKRSSVTIVSAWVGNHPAWLPTVLKNHESYANRHGYDYLFLGNEAWTGVKPLKHPNFDDYAWIKADAIKSAIQANDYVFWIDADSVFVDMEMSLSDVLPTGSKSFTFTGDSNDLCNTGHLLFRNSEFSRKVLDQWILLKGLPFPPLSTSTQTEDGFVGDQVAMNFLLGGGQPESTHISQFGADIFNSVNGWAGNPLRSHKNFRKTHAPTSYVKLARSRTLVAPALRKHVKIVPQHRLNAYPWWGPQGKGVNKKGPIVHFVGPWKSLIEDLEIPNNRR